MLKAEFSDQLLHPCEEFCYTVILVGVCGNISFDNVIPFVVCMSDKVPFNFSGNKTSLTNY